MLRALRRAALLGTASPSVLLELSHLRLHSTLPLKLDQLVRLLIVDAREVQESLNLNHQLQRLFRSLPDRPDLVLSVNELCLAQSSLRPKCRFQIGVIGRSKIDGFVF